MTSIYTLIARWNVLSQGTTAPPGGSSTPGSEHPGGRRPPGGGMSGQDWLDRYTAAGARGNDVCDELEREIARITKSTAGGGLTDEQIRVEDQATIRAKAADGWTVDDIARSFDHRYTKTFIRTVIAENPRPAEGDIHSLAAQGMSVRSIAIKLGLKKSTVHDALRKAA